MHEEMKNFISETEMLKVKKNHNIKDGEFFQ